MRPLLFALLAAACAHAPRPVAITEVELQRRTQELFDAILAGDARPWKLHYAEDAVFADEKGRTLDKQKLVEDITPITGIQGAIQMKNVRSRIVGEAAVLSYDLDESVVYWGQKLDNARYHETDTWLRRDGEWRIVATQVMRYYEDPAPGRSVEAGKLGGYAGTYELTPEITLAISVENGVVYSTRTGRAKEELVPEAPDIFFRKGVEGRRLFRRDERGEVDALIDRRNNQDIVWKKR